MNDKQCVSVSELICIGVLLVFSLIVLVLAYNISGFSSFSSPGAFPMFSSAVMVVAMATVCFKAVRAKWAESENCHGPLGMDRAIKAVRRVFPVIMTVYIAFILAYMVMISWLTFLPASFIFLAASIVCLKGQSVVKSCVISAASIGVIYLVFHYLFRVVLP